MCYKRGVKGGKQIMTIIEIGTEPVRAGAFTRAYAAPSCVSAGVCASSFPRAARCFPNHDAHIVTFVASLSVSACHSISGSSQIFSQFHFHLDRCFKRHRVQMFVKLWHQAHAIFPDNPSRFIAVFVIFESMIDRDSCHPDIDAGL